MFKEFVRIAIRVTEKIIGGGVIQHLLRNNSNALFRFLVVKVPKQKETTKVHSYLLCLIQFLNFDVDYAKINNPLSRYYLQGLS